MYYVTNLIIPAAAYILLALCGAFGEKHGIISNLPTYYTMLSIPHWVWAGVSAYFDTSKKTTIGGFSGLNALLLTIGILSISQKKHQNQPTFGFYTISRHRY